MSVLGFTLGASVSELGRFLLQTSLDSGSVSVVSFAMLNGHHLVLVLFWQNLTGLDGLDRGVVMVLVDLPVDGGLSLFMLVFVNTFLLDGRSNLLMYGGIIFSSLVPEGMTSVSTCRRRAWAAVRSM